MSIFSLYKVQLGKETTFATEVNASTFVRGEKSFAAINDELIRPDEGLGQAGGVGRVLIHKREAQLDIAEAPATVEQLPYWFNSFFAPATPAQDGTGSGYVYSYTIWDSGTFPSQNTYTLEVGDEQQANLLLGGLATEIVISGEQGGVINRTVTMQAQNRGTTTFTGGVSIPAVTKLLFGDAKLFIDDVGGTIGTTAATNFRSFTLTFSSIAEHKYDGTGTANVYSNRIGPADGYDITLEFSLTHNTTAVNEYTTEYVGEIHRLVRLDLTGTAFTTAGTTYSNRRAIFDLPGSYDQPGTLTNDNGELVRTFTLKNHYNSTYASRGSVTIVNALSALP